jgi:hypothetical protein
VRDRDRRWWLIAITGLAFCIAGVAVPYVGVRTFPKDDPYFTSADYWQELGLFGLIVLICLGGGVAFLVMAVQARRHHRQRLAALRGEAAAMPLAEMRPDPAQAPDVAAQPLELLWRTGTVAKVYYIPLLSLYILMALASIGVGLFTLLAPIFEAPQPSAEELFTHTLPQPMSVTEIILRVAGACVEVALTALIGVWTVRLIPNVFGRPFGVTATDSGMDARTELGAHVHLGWDGMRLLELERGDASATRRFALYAPGQRIAWSEYAVGLGTQYVPAGATASEMTLRQAALLDLIAARTGLVPRTLVKALENKSAPARGAKRASSVVTLLVLALILAGSTVADYVFPPTPIPWLNWLSVGSLAFTTLVLIVTSLLAALARSHLPAHAGPPSVGAPSLEAPGVVYGLSWRIPLTRRLAFISAGICLAVNLVPGGWLVLRQFGAMLPGVPSQFLADGVFATLVHYLLAVIFAMLGLLGLALVYVGVRAATVRIQADNDGLTSANGPHQQLIAWSSVLGISWGARAGGAVRLPRHERRADHADLLACGSAGGEHEATA